MLFDNAGKTSSKKNAVSKKDPCDLKSKGLWNQKLQETYEAWKIKIDEARGKLLPDFERKYGKILTPAEAKFIGDLGKNKQGLWNRKTYDRFIAISNKYWELNLAYQTNILDLKKKGNLFSDKGKKLVTTTSWFRFMRDPVYRNKIKEAAQKEWEVVVSKEPPLVFKPAEPASFSQEQIDAYNRYQTWHDKEMADYAESKGIEAYWDQRNVDIVTNSCKK